MLLGILGRVRGTDAIELATRTLKGGHQLVDLGLYGRTGRGRQRMAGERHAGYGVQEVSLHS